MNPNPMNPQQQMQPAKKKMPVIVILLIIALVTCFPVGILAAIAIPNFMRFQSRSKQSECKTQLKAVFTSQKMYFGEKDEFDDDPTMIGFAPMSKSRYIYVLGPDPTSVVGGDHPEAKPKAQLLGGIPADISKDIGVQGDCPDDCSAVAACAGNVDGDDTIDVWTVSTAERVIRGETIPAGVPFNDVNDLTE